MAPVSRKNKAVFLTVCTDASSAALCVPGLTPSGRLVDYEVERFAEHIADKHKTSWVREALQTARDLELPLVVVLYPGHRQWAGWEFALRKVFRRDICYTFKNGSTRVCQVVPHNYDEPADPADHAHRVLGAPPLLSEHAARAACLLTWAQHSKEVRLLTRKQVAA